MEDTGDADRDSRLLSDTLMLREVYEPLVRDNIARCCIITPIDIDNNNHGGVAPNARMSRNNRGRRKLFSLQLLSKSRAPFGPNLMGTGDASFCVARRAVDIFRLFGKLFFIEGARGTMLNEDLRWGAIVEVFSFRS